MSESLLSNNELYPNNTRIIRYRFTFIFLIFMRVPANQTASDSQCLSNFFKVICGILGILIGLPLALAFDAIMIACGFSLTLICLLVGFWGEFAMAIFALIHANQTGDSSDYFVLILLIVPATFLFLSCSRKSMKIIYMFFIPHYKVGILRVTLNHLMYATISLFVE